MDKQSLEKTYHENYTRFLEEWKTFLRFESISADPAHEKDCRACAEWLVAHLTQIGLKAELLETPTKPVVYGVFEGKQGAPTVLFYGHYDVQPVDPLDAWQSPPFEPTQRGDRLYARGAQDNKGQAFYFLKAVETLIQAGALDCTLKVFLEGEEETGSEGIANGISTWREEGRLSGDVLMVCDTGAIEAGRATITMGLRGIVHFSLWLGGISHDLHSGSHGGIVKNPALEMARWLSTLHDADGRVAVDGFYEGVTEIDPQDRALANAAPFSFENYTQQIGVPPHGGEQNFNPIERRSFRPTIEVNGIHSGYGGPGAKTIIPHDAIAKVSVRLVGQQDPKSTLSRIEAHLRKHAPDGLQFKISDQTIGGPAILLSTRSPFIQKATQVLIQIAKHDPVFSWEGGSIPIVAALAKSTRAEPLLVGFGLDEDRIHAPNESFALSQFKLGFLYAALMLQRLASS